MAYENTMVVFFIASFVALFPMLDPFGNMPIFAGLTEGIPNSLSRRVAVRAHLIALSGILFFAFFGQELFSLLGLPFTVYVSWAVLSFLLWAMTCFKHVSHGQRSVTPRPTLR